MHQCEKNNGILFFTFQTATVLRRTHKPPVLWPYGTKHQIDQQVFKDIKYQRYEVVAEDDEENWATQPIKIILLRSLEGKARLKILIWKCFDEPI